MMDENAVVFVDLEVNPDTGKIREYGAVSSGHAQYRGSSAAAFARMLEHADYVWWKAKDFRN